MQMDADPRHRRLLAAGSNVVQRLRHVRRARLLGLDTAHVLHQPRPVPRHPEPVAGARHRRPLGRRQQLPHGRLVEAARHRPRGPRLAPRPPNQLANQRPRAHRPVQHHERRPVRD